MKRHNTAGLLIALLVVIISLMALGFRSSVDAPESPPSSSTTGEHSLAEELEPKFSKDAYSTDDPASPWVVVNKARALADGYRPIDLRTPAVNLRLSAASEEMQLRNEAAEAVESMFAGAGQAGVNLIIASAFRSQTTQTGLYNRYVAQDGQAAADTYSARPGHSEHQTGWAVDVGAASRQCEVEECFGSLPEGQWVAVHAHEYGYIVRYGKDKDQLTGYTYEPWHLRYVGRLLAAELYATGQTMEQFFGLPPALSY